MQALEGDLIYVEHEHSVDFIPVSESELIERSPTRGGTSILLGTLQIEVDIPSHVAIGKKRGLNRLDLARAGFE